MRWCQFTTCNCYHWGVGPYQLSLQLPMLPFGLVPSCVRKTCRKLLRRKNLIHPSLFIYLFLISFSFSHTYIFFMLITWLAFCNFFIYMPNSIKVALAIGHWQLDIGHTQHNAMLCLSDANNSFPMPNCPMPKATFIELVIYVYLSLDFFSSILM